LSIKNLLQMGSSLWMTASCLAKKQWPVNQRVIRPKSCLFNLRIFWILLSWVRGTIVLSVCSHSYLASRCPSWQTKILLWRYGCGLVLWVSWEPYCSFGWPSLPISLQIHCHLCQREPLPMRGTICKICLVGLIKTNNVGLFWK
jgi:hypothetical protein